MSAVIVKDWYCAIWRTSLTWKLLLITALATSLLISCNDGAQNSVEGKVSVAAAKQDEVISSGNLSGLYRDAGPNSPVILIVPGSGPTDLDGNSSLGVNSNVYKQLSESLADDGISSVRVDKRGMFSSAAAGDPNNVTVDIYAADYENWVEVIRAKTNQPCVYMLGHSEGALMVTIASIGNENICGLILVSGLGRPFGDIMREQFRANPANKPILEQALLAIEKLEHGDTVDSTKLHPALQSLFAPAVQDYLISLIKLDPAKLANEAAQRTLIVQGTNDLQTSTLDAEKLANATDGKLVLIDGVNHILKVAPADRAGNVATYQNPDLPISRRVTESIRDFVFQ